MKRLHRPAKRERQRETVATPGYLLPPVVEQLRFDPALRTAGEIVASERAAHEAEHTESWRQAS